MGVSSGTGSVAISIDFDGWAPPTFPFRLSKTGGGAYLRVGNSYLWSRPHTTNLTSVVSRRLGFR